MLLVEKTELHRNAQILGCDFVFYDRFVQLCSERGITPSRAAIEAGLSKSTVSKWKSTPDAEPTGTAIKKLCEYFGITIAELMGEESEKPLVNDDKELTEYLEILKTRPEMRMLFQLSKDATKEDVEAAVRIIEALRNK